MGMVKKFQHTIDMDQPFERKTITHTWGFITDEEMEDYTKDGWQLEYRFIDDLKLQIHEQYIRGSSG